MLATGPNGAGKTNLLESMHVATQGFSPRTRQDANLVRYGPTGSTCVQTGSGESGEITLEVGFGAAKGSGRGSTVPRPSRWSAYGRPPRRSCSHPTASPS